LSHAADGQRTFNLTAENNEDILTSERFTGKPIGRTCGECEGR